MYACYHGADGLTAIARRVHRSAATLAATLRRLRPPNRRRPLLRHRSRAAAGADRGPGGAAPRAGGRVQPVRRGRRRGPGGVRRDDHAGAPAGRGRRARRRVHGRQRAGQRRRGAGTRQRRRHPGVAGADVQVPDPPGVQRPPQRDRHAAVPAPPRRPRRGARPVDDPARLMHDEAERHGRDGGDHLAGVRRAAPAGARRRRRGLRRAHRRPGELAVRDHRLRRRLRPAERRLPGRARRPARHPGLPRRPGLPPSATCA